MFRGQNSAEANKFYYLGSCILLGGRRVRMKYRLV